MVYIKNINYHILGAGGLARDLAAFIHHSGLAEVAGFWDDHLEPGTHVGPAEVLGTLDDLMEVKGEKNLLIAVANTGIRKRWFEQFSEMDHFRFPNFIHPTALLADPARITLGKGVVILPHAVLSTDIQIGHNVLLHVACSLHHDAQVGSHSVLMPGSRITGGAILGENSFLSPGVCLKDQDHFPDFSRI